MSTLSATKTSNRHSGRTVGRKELVEGLIESSRPKEEARCQSFRFETTVQKLKICRGHPRLREFFSKNVARPTSIYFFLSFRLSAHTAQSVERGAIGSLTPF